MIIFFGPMGAGKSMQGQILAARHGWRWISTGQLLRETYDPELFKKMHKGELIDESTIKRVVNGALSDSGDIERVILDGFPRTLSQTEWLVETQDEYNRPIELVLVLEVPRGELLKRLNIRRRADDAPETVEKRMIIYRKEIYPILTYLTDKHIRIAHIDGTGTVGQVHDRIEAELEACSLA